MSKVRCENCGANILKNTHEKLYGLCAPCHKKKKQDEEIKKFVATPGCPNCDGTKYITFSWRETLKQGNKFNKYAKYIFPIKQLKYGTLYKCNDCNINWWLDVKSKLMYLITQDRLAILEKWNVKRYPLSLEKLTKLFKIKKTPSGIYGNRSVFTIFPCSIVTKNNIYCEKSIIKITNLPPLFENPNFVLFADEIQNITPSPYSLPINVRKASSTAQEVRMGFSPIVVQSNKGKKFILNGVSDFFDYRGIKGKDIKLLDTPYHFQESIAEYYLNNETNVYYFYADPSLFEMILVKFLS